MLDDGVDFTRRIVETLRPTLLDNMGLLPAVRWITQETCSRADLHYSESHPEAEPLLADDAAIMVFRLVQEALTNIAKHAHASEVRVEIAMGESEMIVLISDNGVGIASELPRRGRISRPRDHAPSRAQFWWHPRYRIDVAERHAVAGQAAAGHDSQVSAGRSLLRRRQSRPLSNHAE